MKKVEAKNKKVSELYVYYCSIEKGGSEFGM